LIIDSLSEIEEAISLESKISQQISAIAHREGASTQAFIRKWLQKKGRGKISPIIDFGQLLTTKKSFITFPTSNP
jgi:hypothetical protein